jgi:photosystem II stability/assembly factor-like uncharacterized protein
MSFSRTAFVAVLLLPSALFAQTYQWTSVGLGGGGQMLAPAVSPHDPNLILVSCDMSQLLRTADGGKSWRIVDWHQILHSAALAPAFHPKDPNVVYAFGRQGTNPEATLLESRDKGLTWHPFVKTAPWGTKPVVRLCIDRDDPAFMLAGTPDAAYRSTDGGKTWSACDGVAERSVGFFIDSAVGRKACFAATSAGVYRSEDLGKTWSAKNAGLPGDIVSFAGAGSGAKRALYCVAGPQGKIFKSTDGAENWQDASGEGLRPGLKYLQVLAADANPDVVYVNNSSFPNTNIYKSEDGGKTWAMVYNPAPARGNVEVGWLGWDTTYFGPVTGGFAIDPKDPNHVVGANAAVIETRDGGKTWRQLYSRCVDAAPGKNGRWTSIGLEVTTCWHYVIHPTERNRHYICYTDVGLGVSEDGGKSWSYCTKGSRWINTTYQLAFDPDNPAVLYAAASQKHDLPYWPCEDSKLPGGVVKSTDYGRTWTPISTGLTTDPPTSILMDPKDKTLYVATWGGGVWKSVPTSRDGSWTKCSDGLGVGANLHAYSLKLHRDGTLFCLVGGRKVARDFPDPGGLFKSTDKGKTWTNITTKADGNKGLYFATEFDVHPADSSIIYIGVKGAWGAGAGQQGYYRTKDGGATWTKLALKCEGFAPIIDPKNPSTVWFATNGFGLHVSDDGGDTIREVAGVPFAYLQRVAFGDDGKTIYVTTFGGGVWMGKRQ